MHLRLAVASGLISMWLGCQCGPVGKCDLVKCGDGLECAPATGKCIVPGSGSTDGEVLDAGPSCPMTCSGATPVCDPVALTCVGCRLEGQVHRGCAAPTAFCDTGVSPSACVGCRTFADCLSGINMDCDPVSHTCYQFQTPSTGSPVQFDDAGMTSRCLSVVPSTPMCRGESCPKGYACNSGVCVLNGRNGPVQVSLRFDQPQDLDLYVVEPVDGGYCEIFYGNPNTPPVAIPIPLPFPIPMPKPCGALMSLDRDSNLACNIDNVNVENIISPTGVTPTRGVYTVRANYFRECQSSARVPYEVEVRANGQTRFYCGSFNPRDANGKGEGAGVVVTQFTIL